MHAIKRGCQQLSKYILCYVYMVCNNVTSLCFEFNIVVINIEASHQYCCLFGRPRGSFLPSDRASFLLLLSTLSTVKVKTFIITEKERDRERM